MMIQSTIFQNLYTQPLSEMPLQQAISVATLRINNWVENAFNVIAKDTPIIRETWQMQQEIAQAQIAGTATSAQTALLQSMCMPNETVAQLAEKIIAAASAMQTASAAIIGFRRTALQAIYAPTDASNAPTTSQDVDTAAQNFLSNVNNLLKSLNLPSIS
jgi:hypothetical protein